MAASYSLPGLRPGGLDDTAAADALVLVGPVPFEALALPAAVREAVTAMLAADPALARGQTAVVASPAAPGGRVVLAPTGDLAHWTDDVRRYAEASLLGVRRAVACGARRPALAIEVAAGERFRHAVLLAAAAGLQASWGHPQTRSESRRPIDDVLIATADDEDVLRRAAGLEAGRALARDLTAGDPEFMAPEGFAALCERAFEGTAVKVTVDRDAAAIVSQNPLLGAVSRASMVVPRHQPRIVRLEYDGGEGTHVFFAGKGVTYDTGGADLKVGGVMAGMSMDKGGAAGIAGFFALLAALQPRGIKATALLGCVRNSVGAESYVADEIITSRGGVPIVVGNTDAEGRMVLGDMLAALRPEAEAADHPLVMSVATLTGHVGRAYGPYAGAMGNGVAVADGWLQRLRQRSDAIGDPIEWSVVRREDYDMIAPKFPGGPLVQCNSAASVDTARGHQFAFCFLERVSGLDHNDVAATSKLPFIHLDIGSVVTYHNGPMATLPTGAPVSALAATLLW